MATPVYTATKTALEAVRAQLASKLSADVDNVVVIEGRLQDALVAHLSQHLAKATKGAWVFLAISDDQPDHMSAGGRPFNQNWILDVYAIVRAQGATRYTADVDRVHDLGDKVHFEAFYDHDEWSANMRLYISSMKYTGRRRMPTGDNVFSHLVRFEMKVR